MQDKKQSAPQPASRAKLIVLALAVALMGGWAMFVEMKTKDNAGPLLLVYGPGGPYLPMRECAEVFSREFSIPVQVMKGQPDQIAGRVATDGDVYYGGAPYMMEDFIRDYPGVVDAATVRQLFPRRIGIIVRRGNPKGIRGTADLSRTGVSILDVGLENMETFRGDAPGGTKNVGLHVTSGEEGFAAWTAHPGLDAWVTYRSWFVRLMDGEEFVSIDGPGGLRGTPVALTCRTAYPVEARAFLDFLRTDTARRIFQKHGWE
jgi:accessory colonization factor AcfC